MLYWSVLVNSPPTPLEHCKYTVPVKPTFFLQVEHRFLLGDFMGGDVKSSGCVVLVAATLLHILPSTASSNQEKKKNTNDSLACINTD